MTQTTSPTRLSQLIKDVPAGEVCQIIATFEAAVRAGTVLAVPVRDTTFELNVQLADGKTVKRTITEELVLDTREFRTWLDGARKASRHAVMGGTGRVATTEAELKASADDFIELARLRRKALKQGGKARSAATPGSRPKKPAATAQKSPPSKADTRPVKAAGLNTTERTPAVPDASAEQGAATLD